MAVNRAPSTAEGSSITELDSSTIAPANSDPSSVITREDIQLKPWKYVGYRGYTDLVASDDDFFILRRFNSLSVRVALLLQDEIAVLENKLAEMDERTSRKDSKDVHNGSFRQDQSGRTAVLHKTQQQLLKYNEFVLQQAEMRKFQTARGRDVRSLRNWHYNHDHAAILPEEQAYLDHESDLFGVVQKDKTPLRRLIDHSRRFRTLSIWRLKSQRVPNDEGDVVSYYSDKRIDTFASSIIVGLGVILLLAPLWILYALKSPALKLAVITIFVAAFLVILSFAMVTKPFEALGATAAYAAVLMVFLQFGGDGS